MRNKLVGDAYALGLLEENIAEVVILLELQLKLHSNHMRFFTVIGIPNLFKIQNFIIGRALIN